jgi:hypothetical protein
MPEYRVFSVKSKSVLTCLRIDFDVFFLEGVKIPKVVGSNPTVARHIFQACPVWILLLFFFLSWCYVLR